MTSFVSHTSVDCANAFALSEADPEGHEFCVLRSEAERAAG